MIAAARATIGPAAELFVDANGAYTRKQAVRVLRRAADADVHWFEEPVSSDDLEGLGVVRDAVDADVAAGEYGFDLPYFARMVPYVDCQQVDVTAAAASPGSSALPRSPPRKAWRCPGTARRTSPSPCAPQCRTCATWSGSTTTSASSTCSSTALSEPRAGRPR